MKLVFTGLALSAFVPLIACATTAPAQAENNQIYKNYVPRVQWSKAPLQVQTIDENPNVKDLRYSTAPQGVIVHVGSAPANGDIQPEMIRPTAKPPIISEWNSGVNNLPPVPSLAANIPVGASKHLAQIQRHQTLAQKPASASKTILQPIPEALLKSKPVPIASAYPSFSTEAAGTNSGMRTYNQGTGHLVNR